MFWLTRTMLILFIINLIPINQTLSVYEEGKLSRTLMEDPIVYTGEVTQVTDRSHEAPISAPTSELEDTGWLERITITRKLDVGIDGTAVETIEYYHTYDITMWFHVNEPGQCLGSYSTEYKANISRIINSVNVVVESNRIYVSEPAQAPVYATRNPIKPDDCWQMGDFFKPYDQIEIPDLVMRPWEHGGVFSPDEEKIAGRDIWYDQTMCLNDVIDFNWDCKFTTYTLKQDSQDNSFYTPEEREIMNPIGDGLTLGGIVAGVGFAAACAAAEPCGVIAVTGIITVATMEGGGYIAKMLAEDPPDPNYTEIAIPETPTTSLQPILAVDGLSQSQADALNALVNNIQQDIGLGRAIITSSDRATGAKQAGEFYWYNKQTEAARLFSGQMAEIYRARPQLLETLKQELQSLAGLPTMITGEQIHDEQIRLLFDGFSEDEVSVLNEMGFNSPEQEEMVNNLLTNPVFYALNIQENIAQFPDSLSDPNYIDSLNQLADILENFAERMSTSLYLPMITRSN